MYHEKKKFKPDLKETRETQSFFKLVFCPKSLNPKGFSLSGNESFLPFSVQISQEPQEYGIKHDLIYFTSLFFKIFASLEYWAFEILVFLAGLMQNAETTTSLIAMW